MLNGSHMGYITYFRTHYDAFGGPFFCMPFADFGHFLFAGRGKKLLNLPRAVYILFSILDFMFLVGLLGLIC